MSLDTRGVQIANGSKNPDDEHEEFVKAKVDFQVFRLSESTISENLR